jgi:hypothetical protein
MPSWHAPEVLPCFTFTCNFQWLYIEWLKWKNSSLHIYIYSFMLCTSAPPIFLHSVNICYTYIPSWCVHLHCLYSFTVCSFTPPIFLYSMPIDMVIIIIMYLSWSWATCWPVLVSRIQMFLQRSVIIPSASWGIVSLPWVIYYKVFCLHVIIWSLSSKRSSIMKGLAFCS